MNLRLAQIETPLGPFSLALEGETLRVAAFSDLFDLHLEQILPRLRSKRSAMPPSPGSPPEPPPAPIAERFAAYWAGELDALDALAVAPAGTQFQQRVWAALRKIPAGRTMSYAELAEEVLRQEGTSARETMSPSSARLLARAVGAANAANPVWIVIPCHRVIRADGSSSGYAGGVARKVGLLAHEGVTLRPLCPPPTPRAP